MKAGITTSPRNPRAGFFTRPKGPIELGSLPPFEYGMLRLALQYAVRDVVLRARQFQGKPDRECLERRKVLLDQASEFRALQRRFLKDGRRGVSA